MAVTIGPIPAAQALLDEGDALRELRRYDEAGRCYARLISDLDESDDPRGAELTLLARTAGIDVLLRSREYDRALTLADGIIAATRDEQGSEQRRCRAFAMARRATALLGMERADEAQAAAEQLVDAFADDPVHGPKRANVVAQGLFIRAQALAKLGAHEDSERQFAEIEQRYGDDPERTVRLLVAKAHNAQGHQLARLGRKAESDGMLGAAIDRHATNSDLEFREIAVTAGLSRTGRLVRTRQWEAALSLANEMLASLAGHEDFLDPRLALGLQAGRALALLETKDLEGAIACLSGALSLPQSHATAPIVRRSLSPVFLRAASEAAGDGQPQRGVDLIDAAIARLSETMPDSDVLLALTGIRPRLLRECGRPRDALAAAEEIITRCARRAGDDALHATIEARREKAACLSTLGDLKGAIAACETAITIHHASADPRVRESVAILFTFKARAQIRRGRRRAALATLGELAAYCGESPPEPLARWAREAVDQTASLELQHEDRRRLRFAILAAGAIPVAMLGLVGLIGRALRGLMRRPR